MTKTLTFLFFLFTSKILSAQTITEDDILALLKDSSGQKNYRCLLALERGMGYSVKKTIH